MNFSKEIFQCRRCGQTHRFEALIEFPLPANISDLSSGKKEGLLKVIAKHLYVLKDGVYMLGKLSIPIIDYYDTLDIHNWVRVSKEVFAASFQEDKVRQSGELVLEGQMVYPIPFYNLVDLPVVKVKLISLVDIPEVKFTISTQEMYTDWKEGISMEKFIRFQEILYHL